jgi:hypothetical protein
MHNLFRSGTAFLVVSGIFFLTAAIIGLKTLVTGGGSCHRGAHWYRGGGLSFWRSGPRTPNERMPGSRMPGRAMARLTRKCTRPPGAGRFVMVHPLRAAGDFQRWAA